MLLWQFCVLVLAFLEVCCFGMEEVDLKRYFEFVEAGDRERVQRFLNSGISVDICDAAGNTALHYAVALADTDFATMLLNANASINGVDNSSLPPLHFAVAGGNQGIVQLLVDRGADINVVGIEEWTPLHLAVFHNLRNITEILLGSSAQLFGDASGKTPLHIAAEQGNYDLAKLLAEHFQRINIRDGAGRTPLHYAVMGGHNRVVAALLENGADVTLADSDRLTPLHRAALNGNMDLLALLQAYAPPVFRGRLLSQLIDALNDPSRPFSLLRSDIGYGAIEPVIEFGILLGNYHLVNLTLNRMVSLTFEQLERFIVLASAAGYLSILDLLISYARKQSLSVSTLVLDKAMIKAIEMGHCEVVMNLLHSGASLELAVATLKEMIRVDHNKHMCLTMLSRLNNAQALNQIDVGANSLWLRLLPHELLATLQSNI